MSSTDPFYHHYPADFLDGVKMLTPEERGNYITVIDLIYQYGGRIPSARPQWIAGQCNTTVRAWNRCLQKLLAAKKLIESEDGWLTNPRADRELAARKVVKDAKREAARAGGIKSGETRNSRKNSSNSSLLPSVFNDVAEPSASYDASQEHESVVSYESSEKQAENTPVRTADIVILQDVGRTRISDSKKKEEREESDSPDSDLLGPKPSKPKPSEIEHPRFREFYALYPRKPQGPKPVIVAFNRAVREGANPDDIIAGLRRYPFRSDPEYQPYPTTWLNEQRWMSQAAKPTAPSPSSRDWYAPDSTMTGRF